MPIAILLDIHSWIWVGGADRLIIATALEERVPIVTRDAEIIDSGLCETLW
jgi:PIN domain nuclease of toxin-antitoxin system